MAQHFGRYALVIDVETSGPNPRYNFMMQFAFVLADLSTNRIICSYSDYMPYSETVLGKKWDRDAEAFWSSPRLVQMKFKILDGMRQQRKTLSQVSIEISEWLMRVHEMYKDITIFSDNPSFDIPWIHAYVKEGVFLNTLCGHYKHVIDFKSWCLGVSRTDPFFVFRGVEYVNAHNALEMHQGGGILQLDKSRDHDALNDAYALCQVMFTIVTKLLWYQYYWNLSLIQDTSR